MGPDSGGNVETTGALTGESFDKQKTLLEIYAAERRAGIRHAAPDIEVPDIDEFWKPIRDLRFFDLESNRSGSPRNGGRTLPEDSEGKYIPGCIAVCDSHCNGKTGGYSGTIGRSLY